MTLNRFVGQVAIVTGAASGIGEATAKRLAREGAKVIVADIDEAGGERVAAEIRDAGGIGLMHRVDVSKEYEVIAAVQRALEEWSRLDIMHNNAFWMGPYSEDLTCLVGDIDTADFVKRIDINLLGIFFGIKHAIPPMLNACGGVIVNTSSGAATRAQSYGLAAYSAIKAAVESLTRSTAVQYGKRGIRCNAIAPGLTATRATVDLSAEQLHLAVHGTTLSTPLSTPEEQAAVVAFLASEDASRINGHTIQTGGGADIMHVSGALLAFAGLADRRDS